MSKGRGVEDVLPQKSKNKQAEKTLRESEEKYRYMFANNPQPMWIYDLETLAFLEVNKAAIQHYGYTREEFLSMTLKDIRPQEDIPALLKDVELTRKTLNPAGEWRHLKKNGEIINIEITSHSITFNGRPARHVLVKDITERKRAEEALRVSEDKFRYVFDNSLIGKSITLPSGEINVNMAFCDMLGYSAEELKSRNWQELTHPDDVESTQKILDMLLSGKSDSTRFEKRYLHKNGSLIWADVSTTLRRDAADKPLYFMTAVLDITALKKNEEQIRTQAARLKILADASQAFSSAGQDYQTVLNQVVRHVADLLADSSQVRLVSEDGKRLDLAAVYAHDPEVSEALRAVASRALVQANDSGIVAQALRDGKPAFVPSITAEQLRTSYPPEFWPVFERFTPHSFILVPLRIQGRSIGALGLTRYQSKWPAFTEDDLNLAQDLADRATLAISNARLVAQVQVELTERKRAEEQIRQFNAELEHRVLQRTAQLEAANKELEAFSYSVSHDLRAPLRAIDGFSRIVLEEYAPKLDDEGRRLLDVIRGNTHRMGQLIDDLLAFSRLSRQQMAFAPIDLAALGNAIFSELKNMEKGRRIEFKTGVLPIAFGDRSMLSLVLQNLLANAIKFTRTRERARIELFGQAVKGEIICQVKDNGAGFDKEYAHKLFNVFQRLHNNDEFEGTGVGLAIVQRIVLRHGGRVWAEGAVGKGATFYFSLPTATEKGTAAGKKKPASERAKE